MLSLPDGLLLLYVQVHRDGTTFKGSFEASIPVRPWVLVCAWDLAEYLSRDCGQLLGYLMSANELSVVKLPLAAVTAAGYGSLVIRTQSC